MGSDYSLQVFSFYRLQNFKNCLTTVYTFTFFGKTTPYAGRILGVPSILQSTSNSKFDQIHLSIESSVADHKYRIIPNRSNGGLDKSPGGGYIRFREPGATATNMIYKRNWPSKLRGASIRGMPLLRIIWYITTPLRDGPIIWTDFSILTP